MHTEQSERVRLAETHPCRDGDVYHLKSHPAYVPPADQKALRIAELKAELLTLEGGDVA